VSPNVVFSSNGKYVATASRGNTSCIWDAATGEQIFVLSHDGQVNDINFSSDGKYIATASNDNTSCVWDAVTGKKIFVLNHTGAVADVVFSLMENT
uniref:WD40 repeat domain-containing protein n=1 Tax=Methanosarcina barkeri TaxID=2208 RepID=UPI000B11F174